LTVAVLLADLLIDAVRELRGSVGVLVRDVSDLKPEIVLPKLAALRAEGLQMRIACLLPGSGEAARVAGLAATDFTTEVEQAERWRNERDLEAVVIVVAGRDQAKISSLEDFALITGRELKKLLVDRALAGPAGTNDVQGRWWTILGEDERVSPHQLADYYVALTAPEVDFRNASTTELARLGLLPDSAFFDNPSERAIRQRLETNQEMVRRLQTLTERDRKIIAENVAAADDENRSALQGRLRKLQLLRRGAELSDPLTFEDAQVLLGLRAKKPKLEKDPKRDPTPRPLVETLAEFAARALLLGKADLLKLDAIESDVKTRVNEIEDAKRVESISIDVPSEARTVTAEIRTDLLSVIRKVIGEANYGGIVRTEALLVDEILKRFGANEDVVLSWSRERLDELFSALASEPSERLRGRFEAYDAARKKILPWTATILADPLAAAATPSMKDSLTAFVAAYFDLLTEAGRSYEELFTAFGADADVLLGHLLLLEVVIFHTPASPLAILSPTHPLFLWHYTEFARVVTVQRDLMSEPDRALVADAGTRLPNFLTSLYLPQVALGETKNLTLIDKVGPLPVYGGVVQQQSAADARTEIERLLRVFLDLYVPARGGLRVVVIDPPSSMSILSTLAELAEDGVLTGAHLTLLRHSQRVATADMNSLDDESEDLVARWFGVSDAKATFSFDVREIPARTLTIPTDLTPHILVAYDQSPGHSQQGTPSVHPIQPLALERRLRYRALTKTVELEPAPGGPFAAYGDIARRVAKAPQTSYLATHQDNQLRQAFAELALRAPWFVLVDRAIDRDVNSGRVRIYGGRDSERDVAAFTNDAGVFRRALRDVVRQYNTFVTDLELDGLLEELANLLDAGLLSLRPDRSGKPNHGQIKGLIGTLIAARWFRKSGQQGSSRLVLSLDSDDARRWLHLRDDASRADLLGIEVSASGMTLSAIEVKTMQDAASQHQVDSGIASGPAVAQVTAIRKLLLEMFSESRAGELVTTPARREVLKEHFYRELAKPSYSADERRLWVEQLARLFDGSASPIVQSHLVDVRLGVADESLESREVRAQLAAELVPLWLWQLNEAGVAGMRPPPDGRRRSADPPPVPEDRPTRISAPMAAKGADSDRAPDDELPPASLPTPGSGTSDEIRPRAFLGHAPGSYGRPREIWFDPEAPGHTLPNPHVSITGETGSGKTQAIKVVLLDLRQAQVPVLILDFKDDYSQGDYAQEQGLRMHDASMGGLPFSPMIPPLDTQSGRVSVINHVHQLSEIIKRIYRLGDQQAYRLREALKEVYERKGIPLQPFVPAGGTTYPPFEEVEAVLRATRDNDALLGRLSPIFDLSLFSTSQDESAFSQLAATSNVVRLSQLPGDEVKNAVAEFLLMALYNHLVRLPHPHRLERLLVLDEAWRLVQSPFMEPLLREGRAFGLGVLLASQFPADFPAAVAGSTGTKLFFSQTKAENIRDIQRALVGKTSGADADQLAAVVRSLKPMQCLIQNNQYSPFARVAVVPFFERGRVGE
jgi:hypothetical protein